MRRVMSIANKAIHIVDNTTYYNNRNFIFDHSQCLKAICNVLDEIECITINRMKHVGILTMFPQNVFEHILTYAGECKFSKYNKQYIYFTEKYKTTKSALGCANIREMENIHYKEHGPFIDCKTNDTFTKIVQSEQYVLWSTQTLIDNDERASMISYKIIESSIDSIKSIERAEEKALRDISLIMNMPLDLINTIVEFTYTEMICDYKSHHKYLKSIYKGHTKEIHKYAQKLSVQSNLYQRDYHLQIYKEIIDEIKSKERLIITSMPLCINSVYLLILYKNRYIKGEKTIADIVISYLELCDLGYDIDELYILHEKVYRYHNNAIKHEEYYHGYDKTIILDSNIDITNWTSNTLYMIR